MTVMMTHVQVNIHMVRHPVSRMPSTFVGLEKWLEERWRDKVGWVFNICGQLESHLLYFGWNLTFN